MTFKKLIDEANAAKAVAGENADREKTAKKAELEAIANRLEQHLSEQNPSEVGFQLERSGHRMSLKADNYTIVIDAGFEEYSGMVVSGLPPKPALGSQQKLGTLDNVDAYIVGILQSN